MVAKDHLFFCVLLPPKRTVRERHSRTEVITSGADRLLVGEIRLCSLCRSDDHLGMLGLMRPGRRTTEGYPKTWEPVLRGGIESNTVAS